MKKIFVLAMVGLIAGCTAKNAGSNESTTSAPEPSAQMKDIVSPYQVGYSSKFVMDDPKNAESVLSLWKAWDNGDLSQAKGLFADSVELHFANGFMVKGTRDSVVAGGQRERVTLQSSVSTVDAVMAVKSTDKNEHWALIWGMSRETKNGKTDSSYVQETWRFDSTGKANFMLQYKQAATPPAMPK